MPPLSPSVDCSKTSPEEDDHRQHRNEVKLPPMSIDNVSDTARWVAVYRAMETARPDAIFRDPFADRLAGQRGREILAGMPQGNAYAWPMIVRTAVFDEIILDAVQNKKVDLVVNLA